MCEARMSESAHWRCGRGGWIGGFGEAEHARE